MQKTGTGTAVFETQLCRHWEGKNEKEKKTLEKITMCRHGRMLSGVWQTMLISLQRSTDNENAVYIVYRINVDS